ncbi:Metal-dependent hydrolase, endonuclease/exonuclease/phosphatase family [Sinosporangium album]|uniref:Metal-dependent hydrolase, endonuclease/exonuclease/phosphatase family n=1 Tax=Sinosporangium album TaxID=504805 RepID=A0A1G7XKX1_9ACTN|nr:endonuclease/exonuclease/phosphatase family protein [Sinosporangium album]SDG84844.1 Metal-dependent hydrolase, endonuclease/exonuclease/phosphatase family [Sinosporangium album]
MAVRVATYNVRSMYDDAEALTRVIRSMAPDLLCVQEAPRFLRWRAKRRGLAESAGMRVGAGGRVGGVAVLVGGAVRLVHDESHALRRFPRLERRGLALAVVEVAGARLAVGSFHLDLAAAARLAHVEEVVALAEDVAARHGASVVLAGDVNEQDHEPAWRYLTERYTDCFARVPRGDGLTFSARGPRYRIDGVFASPGLTVLGCGTAEADTADLRAATDHLPVVADLTTHRASPGG